MWSCQAKPLSSLCSIVAMLHLTSLLHLLHQCIHWCHEGWRSWGPGLPWFAAPLELVLGAADPECIFYLVHQRTRAVRNISTPEWKTLHVSCLLPTDDHYKNTPVYQLLIHNLAWFAELMINIKIWILRKNKNILCLEMPVHLLVLWYPLLHILNNTK